jgi:hypothetical protein
MKKVIQTKNFFSLSVVCLLIFFSSVFISGQDFPREIHGYKVYQAKISVKNQIEKTSVAGKTETFVKIGEPEIVDVSLAGVTLAISAEIQSSVQSGTIDFLSFYNFHVNNLAVDVEEYREFFEIEKNKSAVLPKPVKIFLSTNQTLRGAFKEFKESKDEWTVTGTIFVFGRFKKSFLKFKRVVPVEINLKIKNPLRSN